MRVDIISIFPEYFAPLGKVVLPQATRSVVARYAPARRFTSADLPTFG